jgi:hypothetical protein
MSSAEIRRPVVGLNHHGYPLRARDCQRVAVQDDPARALRGCVDCRTLYGPASWRSRQSPSSGAVPHA